MSGQLRSSELIKAGLEKEFDKFTVWPERTEARPAPSASSAHAS